jgi:hypothetical protein
MPSAIASVESAAEAGAGLVGEFCSDPNEFHALVYGLMGGWSSTDPSEKFDANNIDESIPAEVKAAILQEYHYYSFGWTVGRAVARRDIQAGAIVAALLAFAKTQGWL